MAYKYHKTIYDDFLHESKEIGANSYADLERKCQLQRDKWKEKAAPKLREIHLQREAEDKSKIAKQKINEIENLLVNGLSFEPVIFEQLYDRKPFDVFSFKDTKPKPEDFQKYVYVPEKSFWEFLFKSKRIERESAIKQKEYYEQKAVEDYEKALSEFDAKKEREYQAYLKRKAAYEKQQQERNKSVDELVKKFQDGDVFTLENYFKTTLSKAQYPFNYKIKYNLRFFKETKQIVLNMTLPDSTYMPSVKEYKYVKKNHRIEPKYLTEKEINALFDEFVKQITLKAIYVIFKSDTFSEIENVCVNAFVDSRDKTTGQFIKPCVLSLAVSRKEYSKRDFATIDVSSCIRSLKGVYTGSMSNLSPVKPILTLNADESKFVEGREILEHSSKTNLAVIDWEDFEHLIRQVFSKYFSADGANVKVTRASRDGGIDAIAFDPDPIKGGKYIIQAKRYNNTVPVSAVRELYGVVVSEGADKGILVTTSDFGSDSVEFAKDKPISLMNGSNLLYLLQQTGYTNYDIRLKEKI